MRLHGEEIEDKGICSGFGVIMTTIRVELGLGGGHFLAAERACPFVAVVIASGIR